MVLGPHLFAHLKQGHYKVVISEIMTIPLAKASIFLSNFVLHVSDWHFRKAAEEGEYVILLYQTLKVQNLKNYFEKIDIVIISCIP